MFAEKPDPSLSQSSARGRSPGFARFVIPCLTLVLAHCMTVTDDEMPDGSFGPASDTRGGTAPGQGGTSPRPSPAGQLTAGEIDDHLNYPQFKAYVLRSLAAAGQPALDYPLPEDSEVEDRFADSAPRPKALDLAFAIDATGSMGDEMSYLAAEFQAMVGRIQTRHPDISFRFGIVFYRDHGDEFVVESHAFRSSVSETQSILKNQGAGGGGDMPEAMDEGLQAAVDLGWRGPAAASQMLFLVADAPPHNEAIGAYLKAVGKAASKGIRVYPLAASSTDGTAELLMRIAAFETEGSYSFLTDDSGIGNDHKEPSIPCYVVTRLDELMTRQIESEIAGARIEPEAASIIRTSGNYDRGHCLEGQPAAAQKPAT
jgi:Mg-chelatase subunit ChlD